MKGRAHALLATFRDSLSGASSAFMMSRLILRARIIPAQITPELDDPAVEARLEAAIAAFDEERATSRKGAS